MMKKLYKKVGDIELNMDIFLPEGYQNGEPKPGILFFHGGGWNGGSPKQFYQQCLDLNAEGMLAFSAEYRLKDTHGTSPFECVKDAKTAMRWLRENAKEFNLNIDKLAASGGSAGGHLAASLATIDIEEESDNLEFSCVPNALVLFNPVFDNSENGYGFDRLGERYKEISPLHNIKKGHPPTLVLLGSNDSTLPVASVTAYQKKMEDNGDICDYISYGGQVHGFFNYKEGSNPYYEITMKPTRDFLNRFGFIN